MEYKQLHDWCWRWKLAWRIRYHTLGGVHDIRVCDYTDLCWCSRCTCEEHVFTTYVFVFICVLYTHLCVFTLGSLIHFVLQWVYYSSKTTIKWFTNALWIGLDNRQSIGSKEWFFHKWDSSSRSGLMTHHLQYIMKSLLIFPGEEVCHLK